MKAKLTPNQIAIMREAYYYANGTGYEADEVFFPHRTFQRRTNLEYKTVSREIKGLREIGFMNYCRGGLNEEGEVMGSGNGLTTAGLDWLKDGEIDEDTGELIDHERRAKLRARIVQCFKSEQLDDPIHDEGDIEYFDTSAVIDRLVDLVESERR